MKWHHSKRVTGTGINVVRPKIFQAVEENSTVKMTNSSRTATAIISIFDKLQKMPRKHQTSKESASAMQ